jgi:hypothetical protein
VTLDSLTLFYSYKARFQIEFLFRDSKQFTGLIDCQARSKAMLNFLFNASLQLGAESLAVWHTVDPVIHRGVKQDEVATRLDFGEYRRESTSRPRRRLRPIGERWFA